MIINKDNNVLRRCVPKTSTAMIDGRFCNMNVPENDDSFRLGQGNIFLVTVTPTPVTVTSFLNISSLVTLRTPSPT